VACFLFPAPDDAWQAGPADAMVEAPDDADALDGAADRQPVAIAALAPGTSLLASDGVSVYWTVDRSLFGSDGGVRGERLETTADGLIDGLAVTASFVVFRASSSYFAREKSPKATSFLVHDGTKEAPLPFAAADSDLFIWQDFGPSGGQEQYGLAACAFSGAFGCPSTSPLTTVKPLNLVAAPDALATTLYFFDATTLRGCDAPSCAKRTYDLPGLISPRSLAYDAANLVWLDGAAVFTAPRSAGARPSAIAQGESGAVAVASDGAYAYWTAADGIRTARLDGSGAPQTLYPGSSATALVVFLDSIVWLEPGARGVVRAPRLR
jgi:hypothetical protein